MFVNLAIRGVSAGEKPKHPVLFLLDEFYSLGGLPLMEKAAGLMFGYGMKPWPIVQNLGQLQHLYPYNSETFFGIPARWREGGAREGTKPWPGPAKAATTSSAMGSC
jgi:hypothetical protein